jgi:energy-converting hydrogenase Eha subunit A
VSIELAATVASALASSAVSAAAKAISDRLKGELLRKGFEKKEIDRLVVMEKGDPIKLKPKQYIAEFKKITTQLHREDNDSLTLQAISDGQNATRAYRDERMRQARWSFNAAIVLLVVGVLIIFAGIVMILLTDKEIGGAIGTSVGAVVEVVSALMFKFNNDVNSRLDESNAALAVLEYARVANLLIAKIEDSNKRDDAIRETALSLATLAKPETGKVQSKMKSVD